MKKYNVLVNGRNFLFAVSGHIPSSGSGLMAVTKLTAKTRRNARIVKYGFYTNVYVEAGSPNEAETKAVAILRKDKKLKNLMLNGIEEQPRLYVEEITELDSFRGCHRPRTGFGFYEERDKKKRRIPTKP